MTNHFIEINQTPYPVAMRRHARARRITLRLSRDGKQVQLTLPKRCSEKKAMAFARTQCEWLAKQLDKKPTSITFEPGMILSVLGVEKIFEKAHGRLTKEEANRVLIGGDAEFFGRRVEDYLKKQGRTAFSEIVQILAQQLGHRVSGVSVRDTKSRWGSCSRANRINLSWRLVLAPPSVARYVIAHEVAHLEHFDHSPAFWQCVESLHADWKQDRQWLRQHGEQLHAYRR